MSRNFCNQLIIIGLIFLLAVLAAGCPASDKSKGTAETPLEPVNTAQSPDSQEQPEPPGEIPDSIIEQINELDSETARSMTPEAAGEFLAEQGIPVTTERMLYACYYGHVRLVELLYTAGIDINSEDQQTGRPVAAACAGNQPEVLFLLDELGAEVPYTDPLGSKAQLLHLAAQHDSPEITTWLLEHGYEANETNIEGITPVMVASAFDQLAPLEILYEHGADITATDDKGKTALHHVIYSGSLRIIRFLCENGADVNARESTNDMTPLAFCLEVYNPVPARLLVEYGADPFILNDQGYTLLQLVAPSGDYKFIELFLDCGLDVNLPMEDSGMTPLHLTAQSGELDSVKLMIEHGADPFLKNNDGQTPLDALRVKIQSPEVQAGKQWWKDKLTDVAAYLVEVMNEEGPGMG